MILAVASGKGGTGKTTLAASLAEVWTELRPGPLTAVDLDVEAPNLHLFLKPEIQAEETAEIAVPQADEERCDACRACAELCQFKAINVLAETLLIFPEMCHGCGGCLEVCPRGALSPTGRELGEIAWGRAGEHGFIRGRLRIGEAMSPPLMRAVQAKLADLAEPGGDILIDAPPGVSCPAISAVDGADAILLVTEPTPFGVFDLRLALEAFGPLGKPLGVVINRAGSGEDRVRELCRAKGVPILAEIPFRRKLAEAYSRGRILARADRRVRKIMLDLLRRIGDLAGTGLKEAAGA